MASRIQVVLPIDEKLLKRFSDGMNKLLPERHSWKIEDIDDIDATGQKVTLMLLTKGPWTEEQANMLDQLFKDQVLKNPYKMFHPSYVKEEELARIDNVAIVSMVHSTLYALRHTLEHLPATYKHDGKTDQIGIARVRASCIVYSWAARYIM